MVRMAPRHSKRPSERPITAFTPFDVMKLSMKHAFP